MFRLVSFPVHTALESAVGFAIMALPLVLGLGAAAAVTALILGAAIVGLAFAGTGVEGRGTLPLSAHAAYDRGLGLGLILAGLILGLAGNTGAVGFFALSGLVLLALSGVTRYSVARTG